MHRYTLRNSERERGRGAAGEVRIVWARGPSSVRARPPACPSGAHLARRGGGRQAPPPPRLAPRVTVSARAPPLFCGPAEKKAQSTVPRSAAHLEIRNVASPRQDRPTDRRYPPLATATAANFLAWRRWRWARHDRRNRRDGQTDGTERWWTQRTDRATDRPNGREETDPTAAQVASGHARGAALEVVFPIVRYALRVVAWLSISPIAPSWRVAHLARAPSLPSRTVSPSVSPLDGLAPRSDRQTDGPRR